MSSPTLNTLSQKWLDCCRSFCPQAFWFWNSRMTDREISDTLGECARRGIDEIIFHPTHGMEIEYLSEEYFSAFDYALRQAADLGLKVWIYDEFGWPSGAAGGKLLEQYPQHQAWFLSFCTTASGPVTAHPMQSDRILDNTVGAPWARPQPGYLDTLSSAAVAAFIQLTHEQYHRRFERFFGSVIVGFFTDEPVTMIGGVEHQREIWNAIGLPWTPTFPERFRRQFGYDIEPRYPQLAQAEASSIKCDYWRLVRDLHLEAYHHQIQQWCRAHGVKHAGHIGENTPLMQVRFSGSAYQALGCMDEPGIDMLGLQPPPEERFVEQVTVSSIARHAGRSRVFCEAFGASSYDIRLGAMLHAAEMFALHGIDHVALMGFQQSLAGVRKRTYWPPLFGQQVPWWFCYDAFSNSVARSVGLAALGTPQVRYALLYPQEQLEQTDIQTSVWNPQEPAAAMLNRLGRAIYQAGDTFDIVFPEVLADAQAVADGLQFPHARYRTILAPRDVCYGPVCDEQLSELESAGGAVLRGSIEELLACIQQQTPLWRHLLEMRPPSPAIRTYWRQYSDGDLFAFRNVTDSTQTVVITSHHQLTEWLPVSGQQVAHDSAVTLDVLPHTTRYLTVTPAPIAASVTPVAQKQIPVDARWTISPDGPNLARLSSVQFRHPQENWLDAEVPPPNQRCQGVHFIPAAFRTHTRIGFRARFSCRCVPEGLAIAYENGYLCQLIVNGYPIDLNDSRPFSGWDPSCRCVDIQAAGCLGDNEVQGVLTFPSFETSLFSHGFFTGRPVMPSLDVFLTGSFRLLDGQLENAGPLAVDLPFDANQCGWRNYCGIINLNAQIQVDPVLARRVRGIQITPVAPDALELFLDGRSLGQRITAPYRFNGISVTPAPHELNLRLAGTSSNLLAQPCSFGIDSVSWMIE